jgi:hypothetical protein
MTTAATELTLPSNIFFLNLPSSFSASFLAAFYALDLALAHGFPFPVEWIIRRAGTNRGKAQNSTAY